MTTPSLMAQETAEAPAAVARALAANADACVELVRRLKSDPPRFAATCARGTSDAAATYLKYGLELSLGLVTASIGPSVASVYKARPRLARALFVAVSQSGKSPDIVSLAEAARADGARSVALVNVEDSPLAALCETVMPVRAGPELSVAATKSFIASLGVMLQILATWTDDRTLRDAVNRLPEDLEKAKACDWSNAIPLLVPLDGLYVIGRGPGFAIAQEAALKLKETCGLHAEAVSAAELKHGPLALASPSFPVLAFSQDDPSLPGLTRTCTDLVSRGVPVLSAGPAQFEGATVLPSVPDLHHFATPVTLIQSFYRLAEGLSRARGHDPDKPPFLAKVTETV